MENMSIYQTAMEFFKACESGEGWNVCKEWCTKDATFSCQSDALSETKSLSGYTEWMKDLFGPIPNGSYEINAFGLDISRNRVVAAATFFGCNTGQGPMDATGREITSDYAYIMEFSGNKVSHLTKIWNDEQAMRSLGWAA